MYLTAQRVLAVESGEEGINAFHHRHAEQWNTVPPEDIPASNPGELVNRDTPVPPGGNRVRSYLDVVAPEDAPWSDIREALLSFAASSTDMPFPWTLTSGPIRIVAGMDPQLAPRWQSELAELYQAIQRVRI